MVRGARKFGSVSEDRLEREGGTGPMAGAMGGQKFLVGKGG